MNWILLLNILYFSAVVVVCLRIIYDTNSSIKTLAYLLLAIFVPIGGILFYFSFGINYRKHKLYSKKLQGDDSLRKSLEQQLIALTEENLKRHPVALQDAEGLVHLLMNDNLSALTSGNDVKLLINGEEKFPEMLTVIRSAKHHVHIEYYIYEDDDIGNLVKEALIEKAAEGVKVRLIYDDFGSRSIRKKVVKELRKAGVEAHPFNQIRLIFLANRLNYRNHRKIVVVDGHTSLVGGINIGDRYINTPDKKRLYWRDTHLRIHGSGSNYLQYLFFCDWRFCSGEQLKPGPDFFSTQHRMPKGASVQIAASGPDSPAPTIMLSLLKGIALARKEIFITTPYFIPGESIFDALRVAVLGGVSVKLLVPGISDSWLVNKAASSYYNDLLKSGVQIYRYRKGFIHAKTMVIDGHVSIVGTANMDYRSFDLNFEVNAIVYDERVAAKLIDVFNEDIQHADVIEPERWGKRSILHQLPERVARLLSPLL